MKPRVPLSRGGAAVQRPHGCAHSGRSGSVSGAPFLSRLRAAWRRFVERNIIADDPYDRITITRGSTAELYQRLVAARGIEPPLAAEVRAALNGCEGYPAEMGREHGSIPCPWQESKSPAKAAGIFGRRGG